MTYEQQLIRETIERRQRLFTPVSAPVNVARVELSVVQVDQVKEWEQAEVVCLRKFQPVLFLQPDERITIKRIQRTICAYFGLTVNDLVSERRTANLVRPRQIAMYISKQITTNSFPSIGRAFGGRDHTTAMWAVRKTEMRMQDDPKVAAIVEGLIEALGGRPA